MPDKRQIPVIVVHKGNQNYLKNCIACAAEHGNSVILIGDEKNRDMCEGWISCEDCESELFTEFTGHYVHMSSNSEFFELICFQRYFYVYQYLITHDLTECVMIDSDALVFGEVTSELIADGTVMASCWYERQKEYQWSVCPHFTYWSSEGLLDFLRFCIASYTDEERMKPLREKYQFHQDNHTAGGICDMTLLYLWMKQTTLRVENFSRRTDPLIDYNINEPKIDTRAYVMRERYGMKEISFVDGIPYFTREEDGKKVPVLVIHAWGGSKKYMGILKDGKESNLSYDWARGTAWIAKRWQKLLSFGKRRK